MNAVHPAVPWPTVKWCQCGASDVEHDLRTDGTRGNRVETTTAGSRVVCERFQLEREVSYPPRSELARRLGIVEASHRRDHTCTDLAGAVWLYGPTAPVGFEWCPTLRTVLGET